MTSILGAITEEQLRQMQKMEAVGRLAGGLAHDFNNLLSVVLSYCEMLMARVRPEDPIRCDLAEILKASQRAAVLTQHLLALSRRQVPQVVVLNLNLVLAGMDPMLRRLLGEDVELTVLPGADLWDCQADAGQFEQVVMNLAVHARDAMPAGGKLTLETSNVELDADPAREHPDVAPGPYVLLAVTDTGPGMDQGTAARIFEPFFTTGGEGKGSGLGLAMVSGLVQQLKGRIRVHSERGAGTSFRIYLPRAQHAGGLAPAPGPARAGVRAPGHETILLAEDDEQVRAVAAAILKSRGYHVLAATNAGDALLLCEQHPTRIHLLLTDVIMPRLSGRELAGRLLKVRPDLRVLYMSGYCRQAAVHHGVLDSGVQVVPKPFTPDELLAQVRSALDASSC